MPAATITVAMTRFRACAKMASTPPRSNNHSVNAFHLFDGRSFMPRSEANDYWALTDGKQSFTVRRHPTLPTPGTAKRIFDLRAPLGELEPDRRPAGLSLRSRWRRQRTLLAHN